jgi:outer membrane protein assembly factor BamB
MTTQRRSPLPAVLLAAAVGFWPGAAVTAGESLPGGLPGAGLVATVGLDEAAPLAELAAGGRRLVHAFVPASRIIALRSELLTRGVAGYVVVDALAGDRLPYGDDQLDAVLVLPAANPAIGEREAARVTAPFGMTAQRTAAGWKVATKPRREGQADWRSYYGDAAQHPRNLDGSGPITMPRWISQSGNTVQAGMRIEGPFAIHSTGLLNNRPSPMFIRRAFSGVPQAELSGLDRRLTTLVGGKVVFAQADDKPLALFDIATGTTTPLPAELTVVPNNPKGNDPQAEASLALQRVVPLADGGFLTAVAGHIARFKPDGTLRWSKPSAGLHLPVCAEGLVIGVVGNAQTAQYQDRVVQSQGLRALRLEDGTTAWDSPASKGGVVRRFYGADQGVIGFLWLSQEQAKKWHGRSNNLTLIEVASGKVRWEKPDAVVHVTLDTMIMGRELLVTSVNQVIRFALADGAPLGTYSWPQWNCQEVRASANWLLSGLTFVRLGGDRPEIVAKGITRSACNIGNWPANGLVYNSGSNCTCHDQWRGHGAFAAEGPVPEVEGSLRLHPGPAAGPAGGASTLPAAGWPTWMADNRRSAGVDGTVPRNGALRWRTRFSTGTRATGPIASERALTDTVDGRISQAVIAQDSAFVAIPDEHRIVALDLRTGAERWSFIAGGRIDGPPTVAGGTAWFGCRDGWIYALDAGTGALRWRHLAAPALRSIVADGHIESVWPVSAPVVLHDGGIIASAGIHSGLHHGVTFTRIDARTGAGVWRTTWYSGDSRTTPDGARLKGYEEGTNDVLQIAGSLVCVGKRAVDPATGVHGMIASATTTLANDRDSVATVAGRSVPLARIANARMGMLSDAANVHPITYDGIAARFLTLDQSRGRIYSLHGGKMRGSGGQMSSRRGDLDAWALAANGRIPAGTVTSRPDVPRPGESLWKQQTPDGKDQYPERVGLIRVGETLAILERNSSRKGEPKHAVALHATADGSLVTRIPLPEAPIVNGLSSDGRVLLVALADGSLACLADP